MIGATGWGDTVWFLNEYQDRIHKWNKKGKYPIRVKTRDKYGAESLWSEPLNIKIFL